MQNRRHRKNQSPDKAKKSAMASAPVDETTIDTIPAGASRLVSLFGKLRDPGAHSITASIASDHLPADDDRTIIVRGLAKVKVLLINGDVASSKAKTGAFFVQHALLPIPPSEVPGYFLSITTAMAADLNVVKFDDYDAIFFIDVPDIDSKTTDSLANYVRAGGGLVIFPGPALSASTYNTQLHDRAHLLPATIGEPRGDSSQQDKFITLQAKNFEHPMASIWNDPAAGSPAAAHFYRSLSLVPDPPPAATTSRNAIITGRCRNRASRSSLRRWNARSHGAPVRPGPRDPFQQHRRHFMERSFRPPRHLCPADVSGARLDRCAAG